MTLLKYKEFQGSAELDVDRGKCRGKLLFISDLVTYETTDPKLLQQEFEAAVEDYLDTCKQVGKQPQRAFSGLFNVRVNPEDHKQASILAAQDGSNLNTVMCDALREYLAKRNGAATKVEHVHRLVLDPSVSKAGITIGSSPAASWEPLNAIH